MPHRDREVRGEDPGSGHRADWELEERPVGVAVGGVLADPCHRGLVGGVVVGGVRPPGRAGGGPHRIDVQREGGCGEQCRIGLKHQGVPVQRCRHLAGPGPVAGPGRRRDGGVCRHRAVGRRLERRFGPSLGLRRGCRVPHDRATGLEYRRAVCCGDGHPTLRGGRHPNPAAAEPVCDLPQRRVGGGGGVLDHQDMGESGTGGPHHQVDAWPHLWVPGRVACGHRLWQHARPGHGELPSAVRERHQRLATATGEAEVNR